MMIHNKESATAVPTPVYDSWQHWKMRNGKSYGTDSEEQYRLSVFYANYKLVAEHQNDTSATYTIGLNKFADLTQKEFAATYLGMKKSQRTTKNYKNLSNVAVPESVDWRGKLATPIKDQGQCGSCWAFSAVAGTEGAYAKANGSLLSFSEQQLVDCAGGKYGNQGCNGGLMDSAFDYEKVNGNMLESAYPYTARDGTCQYDASGVQFTISSYTDVAVDDNSALVAAIAQQPVSVGIEADSFQFQLYMGGIYNHWNCGTNIDHGVTAVGYGSQNGSDYYLVKNSWGASWGDKGYIYFARKSTGVGMCGITRQASYPSA